MKKIFFAFLFVSTFVGVQAQNWQPTSATVSFKIKMLGMGVDGNFKGLAANLRFDPQNMTVSNLSATVDAATLDTDNNLRNRHLREKEEFFNVVKYPKITMKSTKIEKTATGYVGYFDLTMKNTTKSVKLPFTFTQTGNKAVFSGSTTINRRDWLVGGGTFGLSNDVTMNLTVNAQAQ